MRKNFFYLGMVKKLFDSLVIFLHITPVFSRGQSNAVFFGEIFFESLIFENWSVKKKRAGQ